MAMVRSLAMLLGLSALMAGGLAWVLPPEHLENTHDISESGIPFFSWEEAAQLTDVVWVDARSEASFSNNHITGAVLLNENNWETHLVPFLEKAYDPQRVYIVYCDSQACDSSEAVALRLHDELTLQRVYILHGGWEAVPDTAKGGNP